MVLPTVDLSNKQPNQSYQYRRGESIRSWRNDVYEALNESGLHKVAERWLSCAEKPKTIKRPVEGAALPHNAEKIYVCSADHHHDAEILAHTCDLRICPECARRQAARLVRRYLPAFLDLAHRHNSNYRFRHIIFTLPYGLTDSDIKTRLNRGFKQVERTMSRVMKSPRWKGIPWKRTSWKNTQGYLTGAEFGEDGHKLHYHVIHYGQYVEQANLSLAWSQATGGDACVVWVKGFPYPGKTIEETLREVMKYCVKFYSEEKATGKITAMPAELMPVLARTLDKTRRVRAYGVFYDIPEPARADHTCAACGQKMVSIPLDYFVIYCNTGLLPHEFYRENSDALHLKPADKSLRQSSGNDPPDPQLARFHQKDLAFLKNVRRQDHD